MGTSPLAKTSAPLARFWLVAAVAVLCLHLAVASKTLPGRWILQQAAIVIVYLHEAGHAMGAVLSGGVVNGAGLNVSLTESGWAWGTTRTENGWPFANWGGGYIGEGLIVGLLAVACGSRRWRLPILCGLALFALVVLLTVGPYGLLLVEVTARYYTVHLPSLDLAGWLHELLEPPTPAATAVYRLIIVALLTLGLQRRRPEWADRVMAVVVLLAGAAWWDDLSLLAAVTRPEYAAAFAEDPFTLGDAHLAANLHGGDPAAWLWAFVGWSIALAAAGAALGLHRWQRERPER